MENKYAGFWIRVLASVIDSLIIAVPIYVIDYLLFTLVGPDVSYMDYLFDDKYAEMWTTYDSLSIVSAIIIGVLYFGLLTSKYQGTVGKLLLGLKIISVNGEPITYKRAIGRYFSYMLSSIFYIGYLMVAFSEKKQGLHDKICKTFVVYK